MKIDFREIPLLGLMLTLLLVSLAAEFGRWQLDRAAEKKEMLANYEQRTAEPAAALPDQIDEPTQWRYRKVYTTATPLPGRQFLLDNQTQQGRTGFNVLTPFRLSDGKLLLVDRGWLPLGENRQQLPDISLPEIPMRLEGTIYTPYKKAFSLGNIDEGEFGWPRVIQFLDFGLLEKRLDAALKKFTLRLDPAMQHGYLRNWKIVGVSPDRHLGYAFQGFALAVTIAIIFLVLTLRQKKR